MAIRITPSDQEEDLSAFWLITYSDMTTLLVALFLAIYAFSVMSDEQQSELVKAFNVVVEGGTHRARATQSAASVEELMKAAGPGAAVSAHENEVVVVLASDVTFPLGSATLQPEAEAQLARIGALLVKDQVTVRVEGHTDNVPIHSTRYPSNWHLSVARAQAVLQVFMRAGVPPERLQVVGYGDTQPLASFDTPEGRATNRRIEVKLLGGARRKR